MYSSFLNYNWEDFISIDDTFSIESVLNSDFFNHSLYVSQKQKMVLLIDLENYSNQDQVLIPLILILKSIFILENPMYGIFGFLRKTLESKRLQNSNKYCTN